jgi:uncharacterized repeat protein (TIGR03803 family)
MTSFAALAQTPLYSFTDGADGGEPVGGVVADAAGTLYGEAYIGGTTNCTSKYLPSKYGCGTLYSFSKTLGFKVLQTFTGANGAYGENTPTLVGTTLYGTTNNGGASDDGVVFSVRTDGTGFKLLHQFSGTDGENPAGILRVGAGGVLYGLTANGGPNGLGVLFSLGSNGTFSILHAFAGGSDGINPETLLISSSGTLVGSTFLGGSKSVACPHGCGVDFEYVPASGKYTILYVFDYTNGGGGSVGSIGPGPALYGNNGQAPYSLTQAKGLVEIGKFAFGEIGTVVSGPLLAPNGTLYGVNGVGDNTPGGLLYSAANGAVTALSTFGGNVGENPLAQPILTSTGSLIGTTTEMGLCQDCGVLWEYTP